MIFKERIIEISGKKNLFLFGIRGSGKTQLLKRLFPEALYIDLLDQSLYQSYLANIGLFYEKVSKFKNDGLVIVDEIQQMPELLNEVHRLIESSNRRFILTGSSARKIRTSQGINRLGGRAGETYLHPFTPEELGEDFNLDEVLQYGLIPVIWSNPNNSDKLKDYVQTYIKQLIQEEVLVKNFPAFSRFLLVAGLCHGQVVNKSNIASSAMIKRRYVTEYFSILEDTLLGFFLQAYTPKLKMREQKKPKFYFTDPGLARSVKGNYGSVALEEKGSLFEGLVAQLLRTYKDYQGLFEDMYYWSPLETKTEVDFVLKRKEGLIAIEVKAKEQISAQDYKGLQAIKKLKQVQQRIIVYMGKYIRKTEEGIEIWPFDFFCENLKQDFKAEVSYKKDKPAASLQPLSPSFITPEPRSKTDNKTRIIIPPDTGKPR